MAAPKRPSRRMENIDKYYLDGEALNVRQIALKQQRFANLDDQRFQMLPNILISPVYCVRIDPKAAAQTHVAQSAPNHLAPRGNQHLDGCGFHRQDLIHAPQTFVTLQAQQFAHLTAQDHPIPGHQAHVLQVSSQRNVTAKNIHQSHPVAFE